MRMLDLFAGRCGWSKAFAERGWNSLAVDLTLPTTAIPDGIDYRLMDVLTITPKWVLEQGFDFICASPPCEQFSVHGMRHFHPNPPYPEMGLKLFNHTRMLCESSGVPYVMENVRAAQAFGGNAVHHCGSFYLWGNAVPPLIPKGIGKNMSLARDRDAGGKRIYAAAADRMWSSKRKAVVATIPPELASCVCDYAERLCEVQA